MGETVEVERMTLAILIDEAQYTLNAVGDIEGNNEYWDDVEDAIENAEEALS